MIIERDTGYFKLQKRQMVELAYIRDTSRNLCRYVWLLAKIKTLYTYMLLDFPMMHNKSQNQLSYRMNQNDTRDIS